MVDAGPLALGVVVDVRHRMQVRGGRIEPARRLGVPVEPGVHLLQQVGLVVARLDDVDRRARLVAVRRDQLGRAVEGVVAGAAGVGLGFERHGAGPVQRGLVRPAASCALAAQQVALEVVAVAGDDAGLIAEFDDLAAQVARLGVRAGSRRRCSARRCISAPAPSLQEGIRRPPQRVVGGAEAVVAAVPGVERLAGHVVQHPALARLHAGLVDAVAEHVVVVAHDDAVLGVDDLALVAFDVEDDPRAMELLDGRSGRGRVAVLGLVVGDGEEGAAERVGVGDGGCRGMDARSSRRPASRCVRSVASGQRCRERCSVGRIGAQRMPGGQVLGIRQAAEEVAHVGVGLGVGHQHGVVDVPGLLPPRVEDHLLPGVVGVQGGDHAFDRVVEEHRADADPDVELEAVGVGEERLVLADGLALVVEHRPAAAHPARADVVRRHHRLAVRAHDDLAVRRRAWEPARARPGSSSGSRGRSRRSRRG